VQDDITGQALATYPSPSDRVSRCSDKLVETSRRSMCSSSTMLASETCIVITRLSASHRSPGDVPKAMRNLIVIWRQAAMPKEDGATKGNTGLSEERVSLTTSHPDATGAQCCLRLLPLHGSATRSDDTSPRSQHQPEYALLQHVVQLDLCHAHFLPTMIEKSYRAGTRLREAYETLRT